MSSFFICHSKVFAEFAHPSFVVDAQRGGACSEDLSGFFPAAPQSLDEDDDLALASAQRLKRWYELGFEVRKFARRWSRQLRTSTFAAATPFRTVHGRHEEIARGVPDLTDAVAHPDHGFERV